MKNPVHLLLIVGMFFVAACCKPHPNENGPCKVGYSKAILTGYDTRKCVCCGGLMLTFTNDAKPYSSEFYLVESLPEGKGISDASTFPIQVCVKVEKINSDCGNTPRLRILQLERAK